MSEHDDFLRDRLGPAAQGGAAARPPHPPAENPRSAPPQPPAPPPRAPGSHRQSWSIDVSPATPQPRRPSPKYGWRRILYRGTFGLINPGPSAAEQQETAYETTIGSALHGNYKVGVLGKGGVGKTTLAASVGSIFAELRRQDRVVAVDADTAFGRLGSRIDPRTSGSYWELAADRNLQSFADVTSRVGSNSAGLYVLAGEPTAGPRRVLDPALYREATSRLDRHFTIAIVDCAGKGNIPLFAEVCNACQIPYVVVHDRDAARGRQPNDAERIANEAIVRAAGRRRTVALVPDFEGVTGVRARRGKPAAAFKRFQSGNGEVPGPLRQAVERVVASARRAPRTTRGA